MGICVSGINLDGALKYFSRGSIAFGAEFVQFAHSAMNHLPYIEILSSVLLGPVVFDPFDLGRNSGSYLLGQIIL